MDNGTMDQRLHYPHGCWHAVITGVGNCPPHVYGVNKTPINNDGIARLGPMVRLQVRVPVGEDLRSTDHVQWGLPRDYQAGLTHTIGGLASLNLAWPNRF